MHLSFSSCWLVGLYSPQSAPVILAAEKQQAKQQLNSSKQNEGSENMRRLCIQLLRCGTACAVVVLGIVLSQAQSPVSHWTMSNPGGDPWANSVSGGPAMVYDTGTRAPALFDASQTRLEIDWAGHSTRLSASSPSLNLNTFSFSMIIDPTDLKDWGPLLQKESGAPNTFGDWQRLGWQVQHTQFGNLEFVVRGTNPGTKDFYGANTVLSADSGFPAGGNWDPGDRFQIAGGYDAATGNGFFYVTPIDAGPVSSLIGNVFAFDAGAVQDSSPLSVGSPRSGADFVGQGAGFDLDDLQIYDGLLTSEQLLFLANNPTMMIPEPSSLGLMLLGAWLLFRKHRRTA
jgi:hypothetical protein